eukprot:GHVP01001755.1.p1 GENE.GHVP01001755.1~~GHVP01001755.1.p1  ORF type:complete len:104 (+),score=24.94 GHVP01001755.1:303-614(+)
MFDQNSTNLKNEFSRILESFLSDSDAVVSRIAEFEERQKIVSAMKTMGKTYRNLSQILTILREMEARQWVIGEIKEQIIEKKKCAEILNEFCMSYLEDKDFVL